MKRAVLLAVCVLFAAALAGCNEGRMGAERSMVILYNLYVKGDMSETVQLGIDSDTARQVVSKWNYRLATSLKDNFTNTGLVVANEEIVDVVLARREAMGRLSATAEVTGKRGKGALVVLTTNYIDEAALDEKAAADALAALRAGREAGQSVNGAELYVDNLIEGYRMAQPSAEARQIEVECVLVEKQWLPKDIEAFAQAVFAATAGKGAPESAPGAQAGEPPASSEPAA